MASESVRSSSLSRSLAERGPTQELVQANERGFALIFALGHAFWQVVDEDDVALLDQVGFQCRCKLDFLLCRVRKEM